MTSPAPPPSTAGPGGGWAPANDLERALADAVTAGRRHEYFRLIAASDLYLPAFVETDPGARQRFVTIDLFGQRYLPVFTAPAGIVRGFGRAIEAYTMTTCGELSRKWPSADWRLAINPSSPIDAYVTVGALAAAAGGELAIPTAAELMAEGRADALAGAAARGDGDEYLAVLLDCEVFVPSGRPVPAGAPLRPGFPWQVTHESDGQADVPVTRPTIAVVTMPAVTDRPGVIVPFMALVLAWPDPAYQLAVSFEGRTVTIAGSYMTSLAVTVAAGLDEIAAG